MYLTTRELMVCGWLRANGPMEVRRLEGRLDGLWGQNTRDELLESLQGREVVERDSGRIFLTATGEERTRAAQAWFGGAKHCPSCVRLPCVCAVSIGCIGTDSEAHSLGCHGTHD